MTIKEQVKDLLEKNVSLRDSDKKLIWAYWIVYDGIVEPDKKTLRLERYMDGTPSESITRARRQVQEDNPSLRGSEWVQEQRALKEATKGRFINEPVGVDEAFKQMEEKPVESRPTYSEQIKLIRQESLFRTSI